MRTLPLLPRTFVTALLAAFFVVLLPLAAALSLAVVQMYTLAERSRVESLHAADVGTQSAAARESLRAIERNLRQAQVLGAAAMRDTYAAQTERLLLAVGVLALGVEGGPSIEQAARRAEATVAQALAAGDAEAALLAFDALAATTGNGIDAALRARAAEQALLTQMPQQASGRLLWLAAAALPLAVALALLFAWRLGRPIRQLGEAMRRLGEGDLTTAVTLHGPADIVRLADWLEWLRTRLLSLESARSRFLRDMSHDLKTPIAAIAEGASSLDERLYGDLTGAQRAVVALIRHNAEKLHARIDAILGGDSTAGDPRPAVAVVPPAAVDLAAIVRAVVDEHRLSLARRRLRVDLRAECGLAALGNPVALRVAVDNLVSNAVKFSFAGGRIELTLQARAGRIVLHVCDDGPGLAPGEEVAVFAAGTRGSAAYLSRVPGSGQGLAIARDIVRAHGGHVAAESRGPRRGACFVIDLPLLPTRQTHDAAA